MPSPVAPSEPRPDPGTPIGRRAVVTVAVLAIAFDVAVRHPVSSIAHAGLIASVTAGVLVAAPVRSRVGTVLALLAPTVGMWLAVRTSPALVAVDAALSWSLLWTSVSVTTADRLWDLSGRAAWRPAGRALEATAELPRHLRATVAVHDDRASGRLAGLVNGALMAVPLVVGMGWLLTQGDRAFGQLVDGPAVTAAPEHLVVAAVGGLLALILLGRTSGRVEPAEPRRVLGPTEAVVVVGALATLFATYVATVGVTSLVGADAVLDDPAETARWARSGFFQLLWVAGLALVVLVGVGSRVQLTGRRTDRTLERLTVVTGTLTVVIVGLAVHRLVNYADAYGLTVLRVYTSVFAVWLGIVVTFVVARTLGVGRRRRWLVPASVTVLLLGVLALNVVNLEARIVDVNLDRAGNVERFDARYLVDDLGDDAVPVVVDRLDELDDATRTTLVAVLCHELERTEPHDGLGWNLGRARARQAVEPLC